jgi:hypothetical protein
LPTPPVAWIFLVSHIPSFSQVVVMLDHPGDIELTRRQGDLTVLFVCHRGAVRSAEYPDGVFTIDLDASTVCDMSVACQLTVSQYVVFTLLH